MSKKNNKVDQETQAQFMCACEKTYKLKRNLKRHQATCEEWIKANPPTEKPEGPDDQLKIDQPEENAPTDAEKTPEEVEAEKVEAEEWALFLDHAQNTRPKIENQFMPYWDERIIPSILSFAEDYKAGIKKPEGLAKIIAQIAELEDSMDQLANLPPTIKVAAEIGLKAQIAELEAKRAKINKKDPIQMRLYRLAFEIRTSLPHKPWRKKLKASESGNGGKKALDADALEAFSFSANRTIDDFHLQVDKFEGYLGRSENPKFAHLHLNPNHYHFFNTDGMHLFETTTTKGLANCVGQSYSAIVGPSDERFGPAFSACGISMFQNSRAEALMKNQPEDWRIAEITTGQNRETKANEVGTRDMTEKEPVSA